MKTKGQIQEILVDKKFEGLRLDQFLAQIPWVKTRSQALKWISKNHVFLNTLNLKASYRLRAGDLLKVVVPPKESEGFRSYDFPLDIVYEDEEILVVDKPAGLVVHPAPGHKDKTLVNILFHKKKLAPGSSSLRPGIVHRLDKDVSGLLILAKTQSSWVHLIQQFQRRSVQREYWAVCFRAPSSCQGRIETWITRHPVDRKRFISLNQFQTGSKKAMTFYEVFRQGEEKISWVKCYLKTGRTHQIRVHLSSLSCPLVGDKVYGRNKGSSVKNVALKKHIQQLNRVALHAHSLGFSHPLTGKKMTFKSYWPLDLKELLEKLKFY